MDKSLIDPMNYSIFTYSLYLSVFYLVFAKLRTALLLKSVKTLVICQINESLPTAKLLKADEKTWHLSCSIKNEFPEKQELIKKPIVAEVIC